MSTEEVLAMMGYHDSATGWFGWIGMIVIVLAFWGLAAWVMLSVARRPGGRTDALELLEDRLARGEIDPDDFAERRDALARSR